MTTSPYYILRLITAVRKSFIGSEEVYTQGSCVGFHYVLKAVFPEAVPYWSKDARHCITRIGSGYYDITGRVKCTPDYQADTETKYGGIKVAVAFPQKGEKLRRFTTPSTLADYDPQ